MDFREYCRTLGIEEIGLKEAKRRVEELGNKVPQGVSEYMKRNSLKYKDLVPALGYDIFFSTELRQTKKMAELTEEFIENSRRILDVGCGTCTATLWLALNNPDKEFYALDKSKIALNEAERKKYILEKNGMKLENVRFVNGIQFDIRFPDEYFDTVYQHRFAYTDEPSFREMQRVLKDDGFMLSMKIVTNQSYKKYSSSLKQGQWVDYDFVPQDWGSFKKKETRIFEVDGANSHEKKVLSVVRIKGEASLSRSAHQYSRASSGSA